jgi:hypothetical protein
MSVDPKRKANELDEDTELFYPHELVKFLIIIAMLTALVTFLATVVPMPVGDKADPYNTPLGVEPEWYFLPVYELLKFVPRWLGIGFGLIVFPVLLFVLPFFWRIITSWRWGRATLATVVAVPVLLVTFALMINQGATAGTGNLDDPATAYGHYCSSCHGSNGELTRGDTSLAEAPKRTDVQYVMQVIKDGSGNMPPVTMTDARRKAVAEYVATKLDKK